VWVDDTLVGCPLIRQSDGPWFNTPRAVPMVLQGVNLNAAGAVLRAIARIGLDPTKPDKKPPAESFIELHDDSELVGAIARARLAIDAHCVRWRRYRSMTGREIDEMVNSLRWTQRAKAREWGDALRATWNAGSWSTEVHVHYDDDDSIVGYTVWVTRTGAVSGRLPHPAECIAAATIGERVPAWTVSR
jgi:hypothetical protein